MFFQHCSIGGPPNVWRSPFSVLMIELCKIYQNKHGYFLELRPDLRGIHQTQFNIFITANKNNSMNLDMLIQVRTGVLCFEQFQLRSASHWHCSTMISVVESSFLPQLDKQMAAIILLLVVYYDCGFGIVSIVALPEPAPSLRLFQQGVVVHPREDKRSVHTQWTTNLILTAIQKLLINPTLWGYLQKVKWWREPTLP